MIHYKTREEIELIRESADILGRVHGELAAMIQPGIRTMSLEEVAVAFISDHGAVPSFKNYNGFPYALCISINEQVVHGFPGEYELQEGDLISIDCGVFYKGYHSDSAYSYGVGDVSDEVQQLLDVTEKSLYLGIDQALYGNRVGDIGHAIQHYTENYGYTVVRELVGHGLGQNLHESPEVPNYGKRGTGPKLKEGLVIAIEPMINMGGRKVVQEQDGWTIRTADKKPSAHFEHTVAIFKEETEIITTHKYIKENLKIHNGKATIN